MRHALILAGGSGTRPWPISRKKQPKQLIRFVEGRSLLEIAFDRLDGLIEKTNRYICGAEKHRTEILSRVDELPDLQYIGEPVGRDTLAALAHPSPCATIPCGVARRGPARSPSIRQEMQ